MLSQPRPRLRAPLSMSRGSLTIGTVTAGRACTVASPMRCMSGADSVAKGSTRTRHAPPQRRAPLQTSPLCLTIGIRSARWASWAAWPMASTSSVASASRAPLRISRAQARWLRRRTLVPSRRVQSPRRPTSGTRLAPWGSSAVGPTASTHSAASVAKASSARSLARRRPRPAASLTNRLAARAQRLLAARRRAGRSERRRRSALRPLRTLPKRRSFLCLAQGVRRSALASWAARYGCWHGHSHLAVGPRGDEGSKVDQANEWLSVHVHGRRRAVCVGLLVASQYHILSTGFCSLPMCW